MICSSDLADLGQQWSTGQLQFPVYISHFQFSWGKDQDDCKEKGEVRLSLCVCVTVCKLLSTVLCLAHCHGKNCPTQILSRGPNPAARFCLGPNLAATFGPMGQDIAARFGPRTECGCQILSHFAKCGPST